MAQESILVAGSPAPDSRVDLQGGTGAMVPLYSAALFLGSLILFVIQPMFTKMVLPLLGGTPAVWTTAVMFFQAVLLAGYLYAHLLSRLKDLRKQALIHLAVLGLGFAFLPIQTARDWTPPVGGSPVLWLVALFAVSIGLPFFAVSATAPLLQKWFSHSEHRHADDPYFLYVASNVGGLAGLLGYPVVIEPLLGLARQSHGWTAGYILLSLIIVLGAISLWSIQRRRTDIVIEPTADPTRPADLLLSDRVTWAGRARWVALSFVPSALLLAVTLHISTDVAAAPFLWVAPLALYLLSFILVFARRPILKHGWMLRLQIPVYALLAIYFTERDLWLVLTLHLATLFVTAMVCHGELVRRRPAADHLTEFYLWMSVGGLLGGVFCALIAPVVFDSVLEYPLVLVFACLLRPTSGRRGRLRYPLDLVLPAALVALYFLARLCLDVHALGVVGPVLLYTATATGLYLFRRRPLRLALGFAPLLFGSIYLDRFDNQLFRERSFFGVYTVATDASGRFHKLYHGTTLHGDQYMDADTICTPGTYYDQEGPLGQVFAAMRAVRPLEHVGVVGLGTGTVACYQQPSQMMTFFEVDPLIERIARDPNLFRYLQLRGQDVDVIIGDGRRSVGDMPDGAFDLLVLDAFSSDAIPVHLLTREAVATFMRKLVPDGIAMFHISNRFVDLEPVLANLTDDAGLSALIQEYDPEESAFSAASSTWVAVARDGRDLEGLEADYRWRPLEPDPKVGLWTDDYSNLFRTLIWGELFHFE